MPQFNIYINKNPKSKSSIPYLLDVQSDLLSELATRVVIPLYQRKALNLKPIKQLMPEFDIGGKKFILMTPQLAGIFTKDLGEPAGDLQEHRAQVIAAIDLLITGF